MTTDATMEDAPPALETEDTLCETQEEDDDDVPETQEATAVPTSSSSSTAFLPPSIDAAAILSSQTYTFSSAVPPTILSASTPIILGIDEAGRGPVLGPMVYACAYLATSSAPLLKTHAFDDSKKLTAAFRTQLFKQMCTTGSNLHSAVGWAATLMSPRDISAGMLRAAGAGSYNLNAQAHDTTVALIRGVIEAGVKVAEIYVDTVGGVASYQAKLERLFPGAKVTVAKKADSLYPVVSAASVVAKVTRDAAVEQVLREAAGGVTLGSGYPGDEKTKRWLRDAMDPLFGWDVNTARFSWRTVKDILEDEKIGKGLEVEWLDKEVEDSGPRIDGWFAADEAGLTGWYGKPVQVDF